MGKLACNVVLGFHPVFIPLKQLIGNAQRYPCHPYPGGYGKSF